MKRFIFLFLVVGLFSCKKSEINEPVKVVEEQPLPPIYSATFSCKNCIVTSEYDGKKDTIINGSKTYYGVMYVKRMWYYSVKYNVKERGNLHIAQYGDKYVDVLSVSTSNGVYPDWTGFFSYGVPY